MSFHSWLQNVRSAIAPSRGHRIHRQRHSLRAATHRPNLEALEGRCVPAQYAVTDLGGSDSFVFDLNQAGQVVGDANNRAFIWDNGTTIDLGTLGGTMSFARGINDLGQVVGAAYLPGDASYHAFLITPQGGLWFQDDDLDERNDLMIDLGELPGSGYSEAHDINNAGEVVGGSGGRAFFWDGVNGITDLGVPSGFTYSWGFGINELGQVTGVAYDPNSAFLWDAANGMTNLGTGSGYTDSYATGINDAGQLVGIRWDSSTGSSLGFLWAPDSPNGLSGSFADLGTLPGDPNSYANAINNAGQVVGSSTGVDEWGDYHSHAFLWDAAGGIVDLQNQLLPGSGATLQSAQAINDGGAIAVSGYDAWGNTRVYLLTPVPPGTPSISITDAPAVTEGNAGTVAATFTVTLSEPSDQIVTVDFTTAADSATANSDYSSTSGTLTFALGETSKTISVSVIGDRDGEFNESFSVNLSGATNAIIVDGQGVGTIVDDEPRISITPSMSRSEGNTGSTPFAFAVTLSSAYDAPVTVDWAPADNTATAGSDYQAAPGTLTIPAGQTTGTITVLVNGDRLPEPNETFFVNLSDASSAVIISGFSVGTIVDDEPRISISNFTKAEGKKNQTTLFTFTVTLSAAYDQAVTMSFQTVNGTAKSGEDYVDKTGTLTFVPGETSKTITIEVKGDSKKEADEMFYLDLYGLSSNGLFTKSRGVGTILNDD
jgi:probable HAF family extracellular repeat protein